MIIENRRAIDKFVAKHADARVPFTEWIEKAGPNAVYIQLFLLPVLSAISLMLVWILFAPILPSQLRRSGQTATAMPASTKQGMVPSLYRMILVPLDHSEKDVKAISHAAAFALQHNAKLLLMHVEEDVTSQLYGTLASTAEVEAEEAAAGAAEAGRGPAGREAEQASRSLPALAGLRRGVRQRHRHVLQGAGARQ